jgi:hypothetical protein
MFSGTVFITTSMMEPGIVFPSFEYDCHNVHVTKCALATDDGHEIRATISLKSVPYAHMVAEIALDIHKRAMLRLELLYGMLGGETKTELLELRSETNPGDDIFVIRAAVAKAAGARAPIIAGKAPAELKEVLERQSGRADIYFEFFNQARTASNDVVEFLGYYQIIASIQEDNQKKVDRFFDKHDPHMPPRTQRLDRPSGETETVYTRLRNEIAHVRMVAGTQRPKDIAETKAEIAEHVEGLRRLAVIAIKTQL